MQLKVYENIIKNILSEKNLFNTWFISNQKGLLEYIH